MMRKTLLFVAAMIVATVAGMASTNEYGRIARVSHLDGHVSFQHPDEVDWTAASINMALQPGDRLYTGEDGRAEIEIDDGSVLRLAEKTDLELLTLNDDIVQIRILTGLASLTLRSSIGYEVSTPAAVFNTLRKGVYRFDVVDNGETDAIVRKGSLEAANDGFSRQIESGELIHVTAGDQSKNVLSAYNSRDAWDEWTDRRDADFQAYDSRKYLPDTVYMGVSDLDAYGRWIVVDAYGPAWVPNYVDATWSPYGEGRWWYRPMWGWTWVSYEPWGWLPYHYGRWYHHSSFGWCWLPGVSFGFHFWSPALVRFYQGPSWVSWCPLGPGDYYNVNNYYYNRTYGYYLNNLRLMQRRGPGDLMNRNVPGAFRTVQVTSFVDTSIARSGSRSVAYVSVQQPWRDGRMVDRPAIEPTARSYAPAPERPVVRPTTSRSMPSIVRTTPTVAPSGGSGNIIRLAPRSSSTVEGGRNASGTGRGGAETNSGFETGRSRGTVNVPGSVSRENTSARPAPEVRRGAQSDIPAVSQPMPRNSGRSNAGEPSARPEPSRNSRGAQSSSGSTVVNPPRSERPNSGSSTSRPENNATRPAPAPRNEKPASPPSQSRPQEKPRPQRSSSGWSYSAPAASSSYAAPGAESSRAPAARVWQAPAPTVREIPRSSWGNARSYGGNPAPSMSSPVVRAAPPNNADRSSSTGSSSRPAGGGRRN